jgi:hypothetical protein
MRLRHVKVALAALAAAVAMLPGAANGSELLAPCNAIPVDSTGTYVVEGVATATGAVSISLRCAIVQNGTVVASFYASMPGSAVVGVWVVQLGPAPFSVCAEVSATFANGSTITNNRCP